MKQCEWVKLKISQLNMKRLKHTYSKQNQDKNNWKVLPSLFSKRFPESQSFLKIKEQWEGKIEIFYLITGKWIARSYLRVISWNIACAILYPFPHRECLFSLNLYLQLSVLKEEVVETPSSQQLSELWSPWWSSQPSSSVSSSGGEEEVV